MNAKLLICLFIALSIFNIKGQQITLNFPEFKGKTYDFIIFQGSEQKTISQGTIPEDGNFSLTIPKEYMPYTGMSRWLITGTKEGGGLDMYIPGHNFSVSCNSKKPDDMNIIFSNNSGNKELGELSKVQQKILSRYRVMSQALNVFSSKDSNYPVFQNEYEKQKRDYERFQELLTKRADYISEYIRITNIKNGIGTLLYDKENEKLNSISFYIVNNLNWNILYTSGHWLSIINTWVGIHTNVLKDQIRFIKEFEVISSKLKNKDEYIDFVSRVTYFLKEEKNENYLKAIALVINNSEIISIK
ncbi:alkyl hydroperoxide reductase [Elizabethkingia ursingii]|uniref:alkyl hydroperoxide reductase n=1 Tax=Elizabethkingia ursingii TaxID=1756150 RepID=UPI002012ECFF|nr:alkyl hydroperoxide reductase [Elizabethkingia ursingii]MCL1671537.1 alkyl hydroperoxide reductase [Elizabethkingia ursingii]